MQVLPRPRISVSTASLARRAGLPGTDRRLGEVKAGTEDLDRPGARHAMIACLFDDAL